MSTLWLRVGLICVAVGLFSGCAHQGPLKLGPGPDKALQRMLLSGNQRTRLSGSGSVVWRTGRRSVAAGGVLVIDWPDRMRMEVQDPLGGMVALLVLNGDDFWTYNEEEGVAWIGDMTQPKVNRVLPLPLNSEQYLRILLARPKLEEAEVKYTKEPNSAWLGYPGKSRRDFLRWDPTNEQPMLWRIEFGKWYYIEVKYSDYKDRAGVPYPTKIQIRYVKQDRTRLILVWRWQELRTFLPRISDVFEIPPRWGTEVETRRLERGL